MGTILNRRRYMGGDATLPYDAEVEYLRAIGTQYINTQINEIHPMSIHIKFSVNAFASSQSQVSIFGGTYYNNGSTSTQFRILGFRNESIIRVYHGSSSFSIPLTLNTVYDIRNEGNDWYVNDTLFTTVSPSISNQSSVYMGLWGCYIQSTIGLSPATVSIYSVTLSNKDKRVELIPVRVGTTGYMYDKISKQLFANQGTGDFVLGPDKT